MKKNKVAIYARVSTVDHQDYTRQVEELTKVIIHIKGYTEEQIDIYAEKISGYSKNEDRIEFSKLLERITDYDYLFLHEITRLGRGIKQVFNNIHDIIELGVNIYVHSPNFEMLDANGKLTMNAAILIPILSTLADMEAKSLKERSIGGKTSKAKAGRFTGGDFPYGYCNDKGYYATEPKEAEIVKEIFNLYKSGLGVKAIANILNDRGIVNRTGGNRGDGSWLGAGVLYILSNTIYKGERLYLGEIVQAPVIISTELFDECTAIRTGKTTRNYITDYTYLLKDLCTCGFCGRNYFSSYRKGTSEKTYICSSKLKTKSGNANRCGNAGVNIDLVESAIYNELINADLILKYLNNRNEIKADVKANIKKYHQQQTISEKAIVSLESQIEKLLDLYLKGKVKEDAYDLKNESLQSELKSEKNKLNNIKREITNNKITLSNLEDTNTTKQMLINAKGNRSELAAIFKQVINNITFTNIDKKSTLASVSMNIGGVVIPYRLNLLLNLWGIRSHPKKYQYRATFHKFVSDEADDFYADAILTDLQVAPQITIPDENLILIENEKAL